MTTYLYFLAAGSDAIKIGVSDNPQQRASELQVSHYQQLYVLFTITCSSREEAYRLESGFHRWYAEKQLRNEWYALTPEEIQEDVNMLMLMSRIAIDFQQVTDTPLISRNLMDREKQRIATIDVVRRHLQNHPEDIDMPAELLYGKLKVKPLSAIRGVQREFIERQINNGMEKS